MRRSHHSPRFGANRSNRDGEGIRTTCANGDLEVQVHKLHGRATSGREESCRRVLSSRDKLKKLAGSRWNPETDIIKMSCEMFETQAQNKRYLGDLVDTILQEARVSMF